MEARLCRPTYINRLISFSGFACLAGKCQLVGTWTRHVPAGGMGEIAPPNEKFCMVLLPTESVTGRFM